ncbi:unnamed protein product [Durusdinium trenchii]|uniref:Uncharacterized protein n=1 Tax=Durusdinium trenchii TaxID=1381693 RepID=A0ABP0LU75_9DINO
MILELQRWRAPWALMLLLLLLEFNSKVPSTQNAQFVELFAGQAEVSCALRSCGLSGSTHDINIDPQYMDLCSTTGFLLAVNELRRAEAGSLCIFALRCASFSRMSRATAGRNILFPLGNIQYGFVQTGNLLSSRLILMLYICCWKGLRWIVEQPEGTAFPLLPRWQEFLKVAQVYSTSFWMGKFGGATAKRHRLWSNDYNLLQEIHHEAGSMTRAEMASLPGGPLVKRYVDKSGLVRCTGLKEKLKQSQLLGPTFTLVYVLKLVCVNLWLLQKPTA